MADGGWNTRSVLDCGGPPPLLHPAGSLAHRQSARGLAHSKTWRLKLAAFCILTSASCLGAWGQYSVDWYKIAGGGGTSTGTTYQVTGTIGQSEAGIDMSGGYYYSVIGGFWSLIAVVQTPSLPNLTITFTGLNSVVVSWPNTGSCTLQQNSNLAGGSWTTSGYTITTSNGTNSISITSPMGNLFFRLRNP